MNRGVSREASAGIEIVRCKEDVKVSVPFRKIYGYEVETFGGKRGR